MDDLAAGVAGIAAVRRDRLRGLIAEYSGFLSKGRKDFIGREQELAAIRARISQQMPAGGYVTIAGEAGQGKSSMIARLVDEFGPARQVHHFIPFTPGPNHQVALLHSLMAQLILKHDLSDLAVASDSRDALQREQAESRIRVILERLGLELHPEKTRRVELYDGKQGFDFLGCHLHKRLSGRVWEQSRKRLYFLHRWPSQRAMKRVRQRVKELTPRGRCHADLREVIAALNPVRQGWGNHFRTGNAASQFNQLDTYVWRRLKTLLYKRKGRHLKAGEAETWTRESFWNLGLHRLMGTMQYPEHAQCRGPRDRR